jgi:RNase P/RNase MRP subunit POP5
MQIFTGLQDRNLGKKNSEHFLQLIKSVNVRESDKLVSFHVISLFTNVPVEEVLDIIRNKLR